MVMPYKQEGESKSREEPRLFHMSCGLSSATVGMEYVERIRHDFIAVPQTSIAQSGKTYNRENELLRKGLMLHQACVQLHMP